jgi:hypothetical protein
MTVADVIEYAKYGELAQLGVVVNLKSTDPVEVIDAEKQIISYINLGLVELYKRFDLRTEETTVTMLEATTLYTLNEPSLNSIYAAYDELGNSYPLNDESNPLSILTPSYNTIQVPSPSAGGVIYLVYNASPVKLVWAEDLTTVVVEVPPVMLEALLHYIGYRGHGAMNGNVDGENNTHYVRFEASCERLETLGAVPTEDGITSGTKLEDKGFV